VLDKKGQKPVDTIQWKDGKLAIIDQTRLPGELVVKEISDYREVIAAIRRLEVRGAPAIGIAAAYGAALAVIEAAQKPAEESAPFLAEALSELRAARPTAVDLMWSVDRVRGVIDRFSGQTADLADRILDEARRIHAEDLEKSRRMGDAGASLLPDEVTVLTHCNAGGLATGGYGTALAVIFSAHASGKKIRVFADETRPLLQGARLTAWELQRAGIPVTVLCDSAAPWMIMRGDIDAVIVGSDRIAANGDVANKIGTLGTALAARARGIPFYVAAPTSTVDLSTPSGKDIPIEERSPEEVVRPFGVAVAPEGVAACNPAFDVTPAEYVTAIITEMGVHHPPYGESLSRIRPSGSGGRVSR
jgi:methylthioribose-1-phosphate isomerase